METRRTCGPVATIAAVPGSGAAGLLLPHAVSTGMQRAPTTRNDARVNGRINSVRHICAPAHSDRPNILPYQSLRRLASRIFRFPYMRINYTVRRNNSTFYGGLGASEIAV